MALPSRQKLPHEVPLWIDPAKETYFITVCCERRRENQLARISVADPLFETIAYRNDTGICYAHLVVLMPDHIHMLVSFGETKRRIRTTVSKWKEWTAKQLALRWQRDFFEHRLRREESAREKADYMLHNPVRAGLVSEPEDWPFVFIPEPESMSPGGRRSAASLPN
jgi:putative transposase